MKRQVKQASDIADVVGHYIPVHPVGANFKALCPFHNDTRPSLQIDRKFQNFRCWSCGALGDVFDFVMKFEKVTFGEALQMLAQRAGILLENIDDPQARTRARLLDAMRWAEGRFGHCLFETPLGEAARLYLGERKLAGPTVRQFGLGFAPLPGEWLLSEAATAGVPTDVLVEVGLLGTRDEGRGHYGRFRDRLMFPIRDARGQTVGFGGRVLPASPLAARGPKYYNSADTALFSKKHLLYGLDLAKQAGADAGYLAVVEGYTDVMMAHQCGVHPVVATMGTALNEAHVIQLARYAPRVVLVFDADDGGLTGVDRALELFIAHDVELAIATLPDGLDPCDLLLQPGGAAVFKTALETAVSAVDYKIERLLGGGTPASLEGMRRVIDAVLGVLALLPAVPRGTGQMKQELIVTRLSHRLGVRQETVWARLGELKAERRKAEERAKRAEAERRPMPVNSPTQIGLPAPAPEVAPAQKAGPPPAAERQLLQMILAEPELVGLAANRVKPDEVTHSGLRRLLQELYALHEAAPPADLDGLRVRLLDRPDLVTAAHDLQFVGRHTSDRAVHLQRLLGEFARKRDDATKDELRRQLRQTAGDDDEGQKELLRQLTGGK